MTSGTASSGSAQRRDELLGRRLGSDLRHQPGARGRSGRVVRRGRRRCRTASKQVATDRCWSAGRRRQVRSCSSTACAGSRPGYGSTTSATAPRPTRHPRRSAPPTRPASSAAAKAGRTCWPRIPAAGCSAWRLMPRTSSRPPGRLSPTMPRSNPKMPLTVTLSSAMQARLADVELAVAASARADNDSHAASGG